MSDHRVTIKGWLVDLLDLRQGCTKGQALDWCCCGLLLVKVLAWTRGQDGRALQSGPTLAAGGHGRSDAAMTPA